MRLVGFMFLVGLCLIGWKLKKESQKRKKTPALDDMTFRKPSRVRVMLAKVPFLNKYVRNTEWYHIEEHSPDVYEKKMPVRPSASVSRRLDSQFFAPDKPMGIADLRIDTSPRQVDPDEVSPTSTMLGGDTDASSYEKTWRTDATGTTHVPNRPVSPLEPQTSTNLPPSTYPVQRQTVISEWSSLSSGFGDGDIIMPPPQAATSPAHRTSRAPSEMLSGGESRRDTVYTEVSEDSTPRFRTVNSWVRQQSGRLRRAQDDAPPVPLLPPEQDFRLMMPDGEIPRKVDVGMSK